MIRTILSFTRIEHSIFSLPIILAGAWIGGGYHFPRVTLVLLIIIAAVGARIFGIAFNRIFDRRLDALNPRTAMRELPSGKMTMGSALIVAFCGLALYILACLALGGWCLKLSPLPLIPLLGYSLLKRVTSLCHFGIGFCLGIAPMAAFIAASGNLDFPFTIYVFSLFVFCWMSGSDIIYAIMDIESDKKNGIHSLPASLGAVKAKKIAAILHLVSVICLVIILLINNGEQASWISLAVAVVAFILMYVPIIPVGIRFFPISTIAGIAGALVPVL